MPVECADRVCRLLGGRGVQSSKLYKKGRFKRLQDTSRTPCQLSGGQLLPCLSRACFRRGVPRHDVAWRLVRVGVYVRRNCQRYLVTHRRTEGKDLVGDGQGQPKLAPALADQLPEIFTSQRLLRLNRLQRPRHLAQRTGERPGAALPASQPSVGISSWSRLDSGMGSRQH